MSRLKVNEYDCLVAIFSQLSTPNFWLISSTIPISSINPATIPKWSRFLIVISSYIMIKDSRK